MENFLGAAGLAQSHLKLHVSVESTMRAAVYKGDRRIAIERIAVLESDPARFWCASKACASYRLKKMSDLPPRPVFMGMRRRA
jgi:hypothetical protein